MSARRQEHMLNVQNERGGRWLSVGRAVDEDLVCLQKVVAGQCAMERETGRGAEMRKKNRCVSAWSGVRTDRGTRGCVLAWVRTWVLVCTGDAFVRKGLGACMGTGCVGGCVACVDVGGKGCG